jgi:hypothetical protein
MLAGLHRYRYCTGIEHAILPPPPSGRYEVRTRRRLVVRKRDKLSLPGYFCAPGDGSWRAGGDIGLGLFRLTCERGASVLCLPRLSTSGIT